MPRPFRHEPPTGEGPGVARPALLESLARRWDARVISIVAGPGFGKTHLLAQAWREDLPSGARQAWLSCEPNDENADDLRGGVATTLGLDPSVDTRSVLDAMWAVSPSPVCLVFDDVHELGSGSAGARWLSELVTEMSANVHVVMASRSALPLSLARLTAQGQVVRLTEADLVFTDDELARFSELRTVSPSALATTGGWPALAELVASAGADTQVEFLWEEVLDRMGTDRAHQLGRLALCGGGDDEVSAALCDRFPDIDEVVAGVPLVSRTSDGWAALHPLWEPALRRMLPPDELCAARLAAAGVHRRKGWFASATSLYVEARAWPEVLDVICEAEVGFVMGAPTQSPATRGDFGRWHDLLPLEMRDQPAAVLAQALGLQATDPLAAADLYRQAANGFRSAGDLVGEMAAISREGRIRWLNNDMATLLALYERVSELVEAGVPRARTLLAIGVAATAHLGGDSPTVLAALAEVEDDADPAWRPIVHWFRSVAHRRDGDLTAARRELGISTDGRRVAELQVEVTRLRIGWLAGDVDAVEEDFHRYHEQIAATDQGYLLREAAFEAATKSAWLGDIASSRALASTAPSVDEGSALTAVLEAIGLAASAVEEGDEERAGRILAPVALGGPSPIGTPSGWYWRDRAALVLVQVLLPETAGACAAEPLTGCHAVARDLFGAFTAARAGDLGSLAQFEWPPAGIVRAHLPRRWAVELCDAGIAAGNPPPDELGATCRRSAGTDGADSRTAISVIGPLTVTRDGGELADPELRRARVRELLTYLVVFRKARRETVAEHLWPDSGRSAHNLSVTLNYLNRVLEPERAPNRPPTVVVATKEWLALADDPGLRVDLWTMEDHLVRAESAERAVDLITALRHYGAVLPLWRGEPLSDVPHADWADPIRTSLRARYVLAALRAGELRLSDGDIARGRSAAEHALRADPYSDAAHRLLVRCYLATGDRSAARAAGDACRSSLLELGLTPDSDTEQLLSSIHA